MGQWKVTIPASGYPVSEDQVAAQLRLDPATADYEGQWVDDAIRDATAYAETECQLSLLTRTIQAQYWPESSASIPEATPFPMAACLTLFRPPVQSVLSVTDRAGHAVPWQPRKVGNADAVMLNASAIGPVTVTYTAGFGATADAIPADIRRAILAHVAHLYRYREADSDSIPTGLAFIYDKYRTGSAG